MLLLFVVIAFISGMIFGGWIVWLVANPNPIGTIRVDSSEPGEAPLMFLELDNQASLTSILSSKEVMLRIKMENFISHK